MSGEVKGEKGVPCIEDHDLLIRIDTKLTQALRQMEDHENRLREIEIKGSKQAEVALSTCEKLDSRIAPLEEFRVDHEGQVKGLNKTSAIIAGAIALVISLIGIGVDLYFRFRV